jgi:type II secretory ATPase GspE/PulE/Tfp pilus assembly ATPase PilB-like protein
LLAGRSALAQTAAGSGRYFDTFWLIALIGYCIVWIGITDWIGRDTDKFKMRTGVWAGTALAIGTAMLLVSMLTLVGFLFLGLLLQIAHYAAYVIYRNPRVPSNHRLYTRDHFESMWRRLLIALRLRARGADVGEEGGVETEIVLLRKDGATLDKIAESGGSRRASEAVVGIKELLESAILSRATDVHIEPKENELQARFRIDGILHNVPPYPVELAPAMISAIKVLSDMDIAEKRKPQDGTFMARLGDRTLDFRVSTTPSVHGETLVMRILDRDAGLLTMERLGLTQRDMTWMKRIINYPHGMLIVSGPTGSGKTTTLYAAISDLDAYQKNIVTIEDPIEYRLENVTQTQINVKTGVTFANQLRSALRQDPDVIFVGEIRDAETARVALQAAMTGHFVFTTLHANDSITSLFRLLDLGVEPYLISSALSAVLAQRLVRLLCTNCKEAYVPEEAFLKKIGVKTNREIQLYRAVGCDVCQGTGYFGRIGAFELFELNDTIKDLVRTNPSAQLIRAEARKNGMKRLQEDGLAKVLKGYTSVKELLRVTR